MDDPVREQYEAYPYPARDPADEAHRLITGSPSHRDELNHYLFGGRRDFSKEFRALVAGGGTGDAAIMLAQQLAETGGPGQVVYLDPSAAARAVAEARARVRGLTNLGFVTGTIEDLPGLDLGRFDYIDCCGVLHHLADPGLALARLAGALAPGGGLGVMVYAPYGRTGVYPMQDMLRQIGGAAPLDQRVGLARRLMDALPATNWLKRNPFLGDHKRGDAELVDLFLHSRDRAYSVPELAGLVEQAGLAVVSFVEPLRYRPESYLDDPVLREETAALDLLEAAAFAERLAGNMKKHVAYLAPEGAKVDRAPRFDRPEAIPKIERVPVDELARALARDGALTANFDGLRLRIPVPDFSPAIVRRIDGRADLRGIHAGAQAEHPGLDWFAFQALFGSLAEILGGMNLLWISTAASTASRQHDNTASNPAGRDR
ncbi:MAG: class I SAM-dependent methyltransferase [Kiloniellales bacterium]|nr:class I SAM-dependent methyltransferase [Kiloniellales bacterium]